MYAGGVEAVPYLQGDEKIMDIKGKVHCLFEQSGTFKNEFRKLGYEAFDYDIQNNFGETDYVIDLFEEIEKADAGEPGGIFDKMTTDDLIIAFFPCIHFCDAKTLMFQGTSLNYVKKTTENICRENIKLSRERELFFELLLKLVCVTRERGLRLIIENPWNWSGTSYLQCNFFRPQIVDKNRMERGDYFVKPTAYWFFGCEPTYGRSFQNDKKQRTIAFVNPSRKAKERSIERSMMSPDYARNWICDFILGKEQRLEPSLFDEVSA